MTTIDDLTSRVTRRCLLALAVLATGAGWLAGLGGAAGAALGGGIALAHFLWLARGAAPSRAGTRGAGALLRAAPGLRYLLTFAALALALATGLAHPLAVLAGLSVLPPVLVAEGLRRAG